MKLEIQTDQMPLAIITHEGERLEWDVSAFNKNSLASHAIDKHINVYWGQLPAFQQQKIFELLKRIREIFETVGDTSGLLIALLPPIKQLMAEYDLRRMREWVSLRNDITVPAKIDESYQQTDEKPFTRERTYTRPDYLDLVALSLVLRVMVPIWGEFILRTRKETGTDFKEFHAYALLSQTELVNSDAIQKLKAYIQGNLQDEKPMNNVIVGGISREDYPIWLLANVVVRRLSVGDVRGVEQNTNLVVTIHNDLTQKNNVMGGSSFGELISNKLFEGDDSNEQGISRMENFKIKAMHSAGEIVAIEHYMSDPFVVAQHLQPGLNPGLLTQFLECTKAIQNSRLWPGQIGLAQWVMAPIIPPRGMYHLDKVYTLRAFAVAQTYLWQNGHKVLACLLSAMASDNKDSFQQTSMGSMAKIDREQTEEIEKLFPYSTVSVKRKQTIPLNNAIVAINQLAYDFKAHDWILTVPDAMAAEITGSQHLRRLACPHEIKPMLAKLAIECAKRQ